MAVYLNETKSMRLLKTKFLLPIDEEDKRKNSCIFLLTPNIESSIAMMQHPLTVNYRVFESYYAEKNLAFILNEHKELCHSKDEVITEGAVSDYNSIIPDSYTINESCINMKDSNFEQKKYFFNDYIESVLLDEAASPFTAQLRRLLYRDRIVNQKEIFDIFDRVKASVHLIKYTYLRLMQYNKKNIFIDWSYYTNYFFANNTLSRDKGINLYFDFLCRFINDKRIDQEGYKVKTVFVPVDDWAATIKDKKTDILDYSMNINPLSMIYRIIRTRRLDQIKEKWGGLNFVFFSKNAYFRLDFNEFDSNMLYKFNSFIHKLAIGDSSEAEFDNKDSVKVITHKIIDRFEDGGIQISNLTGNPGAVNKIEVDKKNLILPDTTNRNNFEDRDVDGATEEDKVKIRKALLVKTVQKAAGNAASEDDAMKNMNSDPNSEWIKKLIIDLQSDDGPNISKARKERMANLQDEFLNKTVNGMSIEEITKPTQEIQTASIPIDSINEDWKEQKFINFNKAYNLKADVVNSITALGRKSHPVQIIDLDIQNSSTSEDYKETWTLKMEDVNGKRFSLKIDMPKFIDNTFMKLGGNLKTMNGQLLLLPIIKTEENLAQIISASYNKIRIRRVNPSNGTKTTKAVSKLVSFLNKYDGPDLKIIRGDNSFTCSKYDLPIEFADLASNFTKIELVQNKNSDGIKCISFDMDDLLQRKLRFDSDKDRLRLIINNDDTVSTIPNGEVASAIIGILINYFSNIGKSDIGDSINKIKPSKRLSYTEAYVMGAFIPVIIIMAYSEGLQTAMTKANLTFEFSEKRPAAYEDYIKFSDGYIIYSKTNNISASILMNGLQYCNTEDYSIKDINKKEMWLDFLDNYGGRIKADGLDNFYDCMFDPITKEICRTYKLPDDYITSLAYASDLLTDTKYNRHVDITGNRIRTNEQVASYFDKVLAASYGDYTRQLKRNKKDAIMTVKQSAVIDMILQSNTCSDLSILNVLLEAEATNTMSFKGLSGMNDDRSYTLDKRIYDQSMLGTLAMSTGFASNVGITRQSSINASIKGTRGMIVPPKEDKLTNTNILSVHEALNPFSSTHDDPIRTAMGFVQTTKHQMRVKIAHPNLVTNGMDEALPYMTTNIFSYKYSDDKSGKVLEVTDKWIVYEKGNGEKEYVNLEEQTVKNSDGGFYVTLKLDPCVKVGQILNKNTIMAYDKSSYSKANASNSNDTNIAYNIGSLAKIAILPTDEAFEDSAIIDEYLVDALTSTYVVKKERYLPKQSNVYNMVSKGDPIREGDPLIIFQNAFEDEDSNALLKALSDDDIEAVSDLGRIHIHSKLTGVIQDIKIYRTCELNELSPSLRKIVNKYDKGIKEKKKVFEKYNIPGAEYKVDPDYKLDPTGKLKGVEDGILIEFYLKAEDKMGIGDKLIYNNALKGVVKSVMEPGDEPRTAFRPDEPISALLSTSGVNARMVSSIITMGSIDKLLIELTRLCKDKLGIPWKTIDKMR